MANPHPHSTVRAVPLHDLPPCKIFIGYALRLYVRSALKTTCGGSCASAITSLLEIQPDAMKANPYVPAPTSGVRRHAAATASLGKRAAHLIRSTGATGWFPAVAGAQSSVTPFGARCFMKPNMYPAMRRIWISSVPSVMR